MCVFSGYSYPEKQALRYGFQQTKECKNFAKAYLCVQKCLDFNYDVAHSDRFCKCACFMKLGKEKFTLPPVTNGTKWSVGAPTTTIFVTPKFPPTYDEITSEPDDDKVDDKGNDKGHDEGIDKGDDKGDGKGDENIQDGDERNSNNSDGNETSGSKPEGDGLITSADGDDSEIDGNVEGGGGGSTAEGGGESAADGGGEGMEDKPAK